jgi:hypothetical protein
MDSYNTALFASINDYTTKKLSDAGVSFNICSQKFHHHRHFLISMPEGYYLIIVESLKNGTVLVKNEEHKKSFKSFDDDDQDSLLKLISRGIFHPCVTEIKAEDTTPTKRKASSEEEDMTQAKRQDVSSEEGQDSPESPPVEPEDQPLSQVPIEVV